MDNATIATVACAAQPTKVDRAAKAQEALRTNWRYIRREKCRGHLHKLLTPSSRADEIAYVESNT